MKIRHLLLSVLIAPSFTLSLFAQGTEPEFFTSEKGNFRVAIPGKPAYEARPLSKEPGDVQHQFAVGTSRGAYIVAYQDNASLELGSAEAAEQAIVRSRDAIGSSIGGKLTEYEAIKLTGATAARRMRFLIPARQAEAQSHMFIVGKRWYHLLVVGEPAFVNSPQARRFLESFQLLEVQKAPTTGAAAP